MYNVPYVYQTICVCQPVRVPVCVTEHTGVCAEQEQINTTVRMLTAASRCRRLPKCAWIAQQHKHPRSQRAPSDIALTEPDRDMSAVKLVKWCR